MEGPLSKWTNVVKRWQYRWFVLNMDTGLLNYYTSKEKMKRGERRGCVKLRDAQVGIDDEDDSTFTITVDHKTFHFQARDAEERTQWLEALQTCRDMHNPTYQLAGLIPEDTCMSEFDRRIAEADAYLQMLLEQQQKLDDRLAQASPTSSEVRETIRIRIRNVSELVKQTIVCLQHARKNALDPHFTSFFPVQTFSGISDAKYIHRQSFNGNKVSASTSPHGHVTSGTTTSTSSSGPFVGKHGPAGVILPPKLSTSDIHSLTSDHRSQSALVLSENSGSPATTVSWHPPLHHHHHHITQPHQQQQGSPVSSIVTTASAMTATNVTNPLTASDNRVTKSVTHDALLTTPGPVEVQTKISVPTAGRLTTARSLNRLVGVGTETASGESMLPSSPDHVVPEVSYSSSEDEFFDVDEYPNNSPPKRRSIVEIENESTPSSAQIPNELSVAVNEIGDNHEDATNDKTVNIQTANAEYEKDRQKDNNNSTTVALPHTHAGGRVSRLCSTNEDSKFPLDDLYDELDEEDLGNVQQHGSVIFYLISQLRIGMDLTKITLPTFILEKRSTLEMYADFLAHADLWARIGDGVTPQDRMVACLKWYLSAFHAGRRSSVAKKPYNPILGEIFRCFWTLPESSTPRDGNCDGSSSFSATSTSDSTIINQSQSSSPGGSNERRPIPWAPHDAVVFIAEQVSHHPPISAFYAEHPGKEMMVNGSIWTKSKFLGLSLCVEMFGQTVITLLRHNEEYTLSFPCGYGRNILNVPWIELGGKVVVNCPKTGYYANIEFCTKPFYGGKRDQIRAECFSPQKKCFLTVEGEWNDKMVARWNDGGKERIEQFIDTKRMPVLQKRMLPRSQQQPNESRKLWESVTHNLKTHNIEAATNAKQLLEQRQRDEAKYRQEHGISWQTKFFRPEGQQWVYQEPLSKRLPHSSFGTC